MGTLLCHWLGYLLREAQMLPCTNRNGGSPGGGQSGIGGSHLQGGLRGGGRGWSQCALRRWPAIRGKSGNALCVGHMAILLGIAHTAMPLRDGTGCS